MTGLNLLSCLLYLLSTTKNKDQFKLFGGISVKTMQISALVLKKPQPYKTTLPSKVDLFIPLSVNT